MEFLARREETWGWARMQFRQRVDGGGVEIVLRAASGDNIRIKIVSEILEQQKPVPGVVVIDSGRGEARLAEIARRRDKAGAIGAGEPRQRVVAQGAAGLGAGIGRG